MKLKKNKETFDDLENVSILKKGQWIGYVLLGLQRYSKEDVMVK